MSALYTALLESESKESLTEMVCELREALRYARKTIALDLRAHGFADADVLAHGTIRKIDTALSQLRQEG